jgi:hypothetical protein
MRHTLLLCVVLSAIACGGGESKSASTSTPTTPTDVPIEPSVNIAGTWVGTLESSNLGAQPISMVVVQAGSCVDGTWSNSSQDWRGAISGLAGRDSYTGQFSFERPSANGRCSAVGTITGEVGSDTLRWTGTGVTAVGACADALPQSIVVTMRRQ